jgi:hypothetical protein
VRVGPSSIFVAPRRSTSRVALPWLCWAFLGALGTYADKIHELAGVSAYPNKGWIGELFWFSPVYTAAGLGFFALHRLMFAQGRPLLGLLGGGPRSFWEVLYCAGNLLLAYLATAVLSGRDHIEGHWPWVTALVLAGWALPLLLRERGARVWLYVMTVAVLGTTFEWIATSRGGFAYPICPGPACLGTSVPIVWLPLLYVHAALFFHRLASYRTPRAWPAPLLHMSLATASGPSRNSRKGR